MDAESKYTNFSPSVPSSLGWTEDKKLRRSRFFSDGTVTCRQRWTTFCPSGATTTVLRQKSRNARANMTRRWRATNKVWNWDRFFRFFFSFENTNSTSPTSYVDGPPDRTEENGERSTEAYVSELNNTETQKYIEYAAVVVVLLSPVTPRPVFAKYRNTRKRLSVGNIHHPPRYYLMDVSPDFQWEGYRLAVFHGEWKTTFPPTSI